MSRVAEKRTEATKSMSSGDHGGHFRGHSAKFCLHVFHGNIFISLFNYTASISGFKAAGGWMINVKMNKKFCDWKRCGMIKLPSLHLFGGAFERFLGVR